MMNTPACWTSRGRCPICGGDGGQMDYLLFSTTTVITSLLTVIINITVGILKIMCCKVVNLEVNETQVRLGSGFRFVQPVPGARGSADVA